MSSPLGSGVDGAPSWLHLKWAVGLAAGAMAAYYLVRGPVSAKNAKQPGVLITDFDSFLVAPGDAPTGNTNAANAKKKKLGKPGEWGVFDEFLKAAEEEEDHRDPLVFDSFLKTAIPGAAQPSKLKATVPPAPEERPSPDMAKVAVFYGTEFGFSKEIAEKLAAAMKSTKKLWPSIVDMAAHPEGYDLAGEQAALFVCSTQGDGVPPTEARDFCEWLFSGKAGQLPNLHYSVCALGDKSYTHFCRCGKTIERALAETGARELTPRVDVNKEDWKAIDGWIEAVLAGLPALGLKTFEQLGVACEADSGVDSALAPKRWGKSRPFPARVVAVEGLCNVTDKSDKNTFRVEFDLGDSGMSYLPGDALGIYATNSPSVVSDLLSASGLDAKSPVPVPAHHYQEEGLDARGSMTLKEALSKCYDLRSPKPDIFKLLSSFPPAPATSNGNGNGAAAHHAAPPSVAVLIFDEAEQQAYLAERHVSDILHDFLPPGCKLTTQQLLPVLRPLQPRLYSISSSPLEGQTRVQATIAEVKYTSRGIDRIGVCSTYVSERIAVGQEVPVYISKNPDFRLPPSRSTPVLMVGPGTGLAPFRSFIQERLLEESSAPAGQMVLYFGCRRSDQDYLYGPLLEGWAAKGDITLFTAFSRQQADKVYVQDRLRQSADLVWSLLHDQGAHFYVCGDASSMAGSVEKELLRLFEERLGTGPEGAAAYLEKLSQEHRYERDVWY